MRTIIAVAVAVLLGFMASGVAQAAKHAPASQPAAGHGRMAGVLDKLNLTDDQKAQVKAIMTQAKADAKQATDKAAKKEIHKAAWEKVRTTVLTDAQRKQLEQMKADRKAKADKAAAPAATQAK